MVPGNNPEKLNAFVGIKAADVCAIRKQPMTVVLDRPAIALAGDSLAGQTFGDAEIAHGPYRGLVVSQTSRGRGRDGSKVASVIT